MAVEDAFVCLMDVKSARVVRRGSFESAYLRDLRIIRWLKLLGIIKRRIIILGENISFVFLEKQLKIRNSGQAKLISAMTVNGFIFLQYIVGFTLMSGEATGLVPLQLNSPCR